MSYRIEPVGSSAAAGLDAAYAALEAEFAPRGELERREIIERWLDEGMVPAGGEGLLRAYHLLVARDEHGALAGVRDCHVVLDPRANVVVVYLAHVLVLPAFRRTGLATRLRSEPLALAQRALGEAGMGGRPVDVLIAAEMEPAALDDDASLVRLVAYGKDGFAAIAPAALPYCQPDFRDLGAAPHEKPRPIPLLAVVRYLGHEGAPSLPRRLAQAFVQHLYAVFASHVQPAHLAALERRTLGVLEAFTETEVPLLPLPRTTDDRDALRPLCRPAVLPFFPEEVR